MTRIYRLPGLLCLLGAGAFAQTTTVTGTITDPEGDLLQGSCSIQAVAPFTASAGWRVVGTPMVVSFQGGTFSANLAPTDSASPSGQYYKVTCAVPAQTVGGRLVGPHSWGPRYWLVPTSTTQLDISQIEVTSPPPQPSWTILPQQISGGTLTPGVNCFNVNSAGYISSLALCTTLLTPLFQPTIATGTTAQYFRGDLSLATFPTTWPWTGITGAPSIANTVFGRSGTVTAQTGDYTSDQVTEGSTNLYFTPARAQAAMAGLYQTPITTGTTAQYFRGDLSLATFPTTWAWSALTGIPTLTNTVFGRSGAVTAQAGDYTSDQVTEGISHLYFTNARAQGAMAGLYQTPITTGATAQYFRGDLSLATFPTTWAWANLTGVPTLTNTVFGRGGAVTAQSGDYLGIYEPVLGSPTTNGYVLTSTTLGVRSWVAVQAPITTGTTAQYFRGDLSLATFPTIWPWTGLSGVPTLTNTVFGRSGTVTAQSGDYSSDLVTEGTSNLYFTNARAQAAMAGIYQSPITTGTTSQYFRGDLSLATFPTTWPWSGLSGIPTLANTVFGRSGTVTAQSGDYTTSQVTESGNLYFTNARAQAAMAGLYQSPITTGTTAQYFRGDLSLATFPIMWAWANLTGVPTLANTVFGRSGAVVAQSGDYSGFYEPVLGNPSTSGYVLSSTTGGVRSWIAPVTLGGANTWTAAQTFNAGLYLSTSWAQFIANGSNNAFFGGGGNSNTGTYNTGFGQAAVQQVTTGYANTGFGAQALYSVITGSSNTAVGYGALYKNNSYDNTAVGVAAGNYYTGTNWNTNSSESVFLGMSTNAYGANDTNEIVIGYGATGAGSNTAVTGNASLTDVYDGGAGGAANHHENGQFLTSRYSAAGTAIPACNSSTLLEEVAVTDATSATAGSAYASGGTYTVPVRCIFNSTGSVYTWVIE